MKRNLKKDIKERNINKLVIENVSFCIFVVKFYKGNELKFVVTLSFKEIFKLLDKDLKIKLSGDNVLSAIFLKDWILKQRIIFL